MHPMEQLRFVARAAGADSSLLVAEAAQALAMFSGDPQALLVACKQLLNRQPTVGGLWWLCSAMLNATDASAQARATVMALQSDVTASTLTSALEQRGGRVELDGIAGFEAVSGLDEPIGRPLVLTGGWPDVVVAALAASRGSALVIEVDGVGSATVRRLERCDVEAETVAAERMAGAAAAADVVVVEAGAVGSSSALVDVAGSSLVAVAASVGTPVWLVVPPWRVLPDALWPDVLRGRKRWPGPSWMAPTELVDVARVDAVVCGDEFTAVSAEAFSPSPISCGWQSAPELVGIIADAL